MTELTKLHILSTAFNLFSKKGFKEITMKDLVKASGLSKGAFYHYFKSKEELYDQALETYLTGFLENMKPEHDVNLSVREMLKTMFSQFASLAENMEKTGKEGEGGSLSAYMLFIQSAIQRPRIREIAKQFGHIYFSQFNLFIKAAQEKGEIRKDLNPEVLTLHIASVMEGLVLIYSFGIEMESLNTSFNQVIDQLFDLIELKKPNI